MWIVGLLVIAAIVIAVLFLNRFYVKATREIAIIRTGLGGQRVVLDGGTKSLPILHKVSEINMRTVRLENTAPFDVTGHPAMSIPCGMSNGLPVGCRLVGKHWAESTIYQTAAAFESTGDWKDM